MFAYVRNVIFRRIIPVHQPILFNVSTVDPGAIVHPSKNNKLVEVDVVNYGSSGLYFSAYNQHGFLLNSGVRIIGPCAAFPRNAFCWNVKDFKDINEESLSLFFVLEPKLDLLLIGKGATNIQVDCLKLQNICYKHKLAVEILPTQSAVGTFNFLNSEGRYVAAGLIPPHRIDIYDPADREASQLLAAEELVATSNLLQQKSSEAQKFLEDASAKPLKLIRSPLLDPESDSDSRDKP
ncbi:unnamed protein product [Dicrocoelium dendriticum]|nr:unnamed protein product [Dicrocoelium dendriticum]